MTRLMLLERGEELTEESWGALASQASSLRLKLLEPAPPFRDGQVIQVAPLGAGGARRRDLLLWRTGRAFNLHPLEGEGARAEGEPLGRVVAIERGEVVFSLERGLLARLPARWLPRAIDALEVLGRVRHPFTPSLCLGSAGACLSGVRDKYDREAEARRYSSMAPAGLDPFEREIVSRHVRAGGRILDIGCGAGREALGLAREGFRVVAIDIAPRMVEAARANAEREGLAITFQVQSATELDEPPGSFDAAYWAGSYHHIPGRALRVETLRRIGRALAPDGVLILMVVYRGPRGLISRSRLVDFLRRVGERLTSTWPLSEPGDGCMLETSEASDPREACFFHDFARPEEVRRELEAAGLVASEVAPGSWVCRMALP